MAAAFVAPRAGAAEPKFRSCMNLGRVPTTGAYSPLGVVVLSVPSQHQVSKHAWHSAGRVVYARSAIAHAKQRGHEATVPFSVNDLRPFKTTAVDSGFSYAS